MIRHVLACTVAATCLWGGNPAVADGVTVDCRLVTFAQETATGGQETFTGVAFGAVAGSTGLDWVRCYVTVDGTEADSTDLGIGQDAAVTFGQVTYTASNTQVVRLCTDSSAGLSCPRVVTRQVPPQEILDLLDSVTHLGREVVSPAVCPVLISLRPGVPGLVDISSEGDTWVLGAPAWECPPYEVEPTSPPVLLETGGI